MELTKEQVRSEGIAASQLKTDPGFQRAQALAREKIILQWTAAKTVDEREALWHDWHALRRFEDQLDVVEGRGLIVQAEINRHTKSA